VSGLGLDNVVWSTKDGGHETEGTVALGHNIGLHITIVVLAGPDETSVGLDGEGDEIVNETMLVPDTELLELGLVGALKDLFEDVLEATVVLLQDGVLGREEERELTADSVVEGGMGEFVDRGVSVVHAEHNTCTLELEHLHVHWV
jgi:hypothetical protein